MWAYKNNANSIHFIKQNKYFYPKLVMDNYWIFSLIFFKTITTILEKLYILNHKNKGIFLFF
jgi:hypothetical protein